jgi:hypothetical protein
MRRTRLHLGPLLLALALLGCSEDTERKPTDGAADAPPASDGVASEGTATGKFEMNVNTETLGVIEVRFLKGRCLSRLYIDSDVAEARAAALAFAQAVAQTIPLDGSKPANDDELKALLPGSNVVDDWQEDPSEPTSGPWLITTTAFDWINGGGKPFADNGFEAAAGDWYIKSAESWQLKIELVNMTTPAGAEAAFRGASWDQGEAP